MANDYFPDSPENQDTWLTQFSEQLGIQGPTLPWAAQKIQQEQAFVATFTALTGAVLSAQAALDTALGTLRDKVKGDDLRKLRELIASIKTSPGYNEGIGSAMNILSRADTFDPATYQATLTARAEHGHVRLKGTKRGADAYNIRRRPRGAAQWELVFARRKTFPVDDIPPLAQPGVPQWFEYQATAVLNDEEVGKPSDIVAVLFGG